VYKHVCEKIFQCNVKSIVLTVSNKILKCKIKINYQYIKSIVVYPFVIKSLSVI